MDNLGVRACQWCNEPFQPVREAQRFCSNGGQCRLSYHKDLMQNLKSEDQTYTEDMIMTQNQAVKDYLDSGQSLTRMKAVRQLGIIELPARVSQLRREGYPIITVRKTVRTRYGKTSIAVWSKG